MKLTNEAVMRLREIREELDPKWSNQLDEKLNQIQTIAGTAKVFIHADREPYSLLFYIESINGGEGLHGGVTFHGSEEIGYSESDSVQLVPQYGYAIHT